MELALVSYDYPPVPILASHRMGPATVWALGVPYEGVALLDTGFEGDIISQLIWEPDYQAPDKTWFLPTGL
jgi:hypothetical protein